MPEPSNLSLFHATSKIVGVSKRKQLFCQILTTFSPASTNERILSLNRYLSSSLQILNIYNFVLGNC